MVSPMTTGTEGGSEAVPATPGSSKPWLDLISDATAHFSSYMQKCDNIDKQLGELKALADSSTDRQLRMFWANLEVLKPSIYARPPIPVVVPRFKDRRAINRIASDLLERALVVSFDREDVNAVMIGVRDDLAVCSRGTAWVRYEAQGEEADSFTERVCFDHVDRCDFLHDPARSWREVDWVARGSWMTLEKGLQRFGDAFKMAQLEQGKEKSDEYKGEKKARVWEIWHKGQNKVVWVSPGLDRVLDDKPPFLQLEGFFPCPKPAFGTLQRRTTLPIPDILQYKDQLEEINVLTARISQLSDGLKLKGFYSSGSEDISAAVERAITSKNNNIMIPVSNFAALGGVGLKDAVLWLPIKEVAETIQACVLLRKQLMDDVREITGISDIMRGDTDPNETLGAQELKSQYGSVRIKEKQAAMVAFARDLSRIAGEVMAENFQPETLLEMSQLELPSEADIQGQIQEIVMQAQQAAASPEAQQAAMENPQAIAQAKEQLKQQVAQLQETVTIEKLVQLFRDQKMRPFILDIETDSTIQPNEDAEKQRRNEFIGAVGGFIQQAAPLVMQMPAAGPFVAEALKFVASAFRAGRDLDSAIDDFAEQVSQAASQPKGPSPDEVKAKADADALQAKVEADLKIKDQEFAHKERMFKLEADEKEKEAARKERDHERELAAKAQEFDHRRSEAEFAANSAKADSERAESEHRRKLEMEQASTQAELQRALAEAGIPPDYSFDRDREIMAQMLEAMQKTLAKVEESNANIAEGMQAIAKAAMAPRKMRGRDGFEFVSEAQVN